MNKAELKARFFGVFNRPDLTDAQQEFYIQAASVRLSRVLRSPSMEGLIEREVDANNEIHLPNNFLDHLDLYPDAANTPSTKALTPQGLRNLPKTFGAYPTHYARIGDRYRLHPTVPEGTVMWLYYYATPQPLIFDTDTSSLSRTAYDVLIYGACVDAATFFVDDRISAFEELYRNRLGEIMEQSALTKNTGGSPAVAPGTTQEV